jgi:glycosyltransferase involved in cell wall biosynthesis
MKLSVAMITYNHERFIAQAVNSVLRQRVNFPYEIVIGDDCSTDGTSAIVADFHRLYPNRFVPFLRGKNLGAVPNFVATLTACRGQYVALLEGDDYWTCEDKLQRQVDFLDANPDYVISCHRAQVQDEVGTWLKLAQFPIRPAGTYALEDLLTPDNFIMTCSTVYRRDAVARIPSWFGNLKLGDWPLMALAAQAGKIHLTEHAWAVYRVHTGGLWSTRGVTRRLRETIQMFTALAAELDDRHTEKIRETIIHFALEWAQIARTEGRRMDTGRAVASCLRHGGWRFRGRRRMLAGFAAYALLGPSYRLFRKAIHKNLNHKGIS